MFLNDDPSAVASPPAPAAPGTPGWFTGGDPAASLEATIYTADWGNMVQGELKSILDAAGVAPDKANNAQVLAAIGRLQVRETRGLKGSAAGGTATASWTADSLVAETALNGHVFVGTGLTLNFNGATTGAGGMDTGTLAGAQDISVYAIYNPTTNTWSTLGTLTATSGGRVYTGSAMPAGYIASALIWNGITASGHVPAFAQTDRTVWIRQVTAVNSVAGSSTPTAYSLAAAISAKAKTVFGVATIQSSVSNTVEIASDANGLAQCGVGTTIDSSGVTGSYGPMPLPTPQMLWMWHAGGTSTLTLNVSGYTF